MPDGPDTTLPWLPNAGNATPASARRAALYACSRAADIDDAAMLLDALGLRRSEVTG